MNGGMFHPVQKTWDCHSPEEVLLGWPLFLAAHQYMLASILLSFSNSLLERWGWQHTVVIIIITMNCSQCDLMVFPVLLSLGLCMHLCFHGRVLFFILFILCICEPGENSISDSSSQENQTCQDKDGTFVVKSAPHTKRFRKDSVKLSERNHCFRRSEEIWLVVISMVCWILLSPCSSLGQQQEWTIRIKRKGWRQELFLLTSSSG